MNKRIYIIVRTEDLISSNKLAEEIDPDSGGANTFGAVKLSKDSTEPATHTACSTLVSGEVLPQIQEALGSVASAKMYIQGETVIGQGINQDTGESFDVTCSSFDDAILKEDLQLLKYDEV